MEELDVLKLRDESDTPVQRQNTSIGDEGKESSSPHNPLQYLGGAGSPSSEQSGVGSWNSAIFDNHNQKDVDDPEAEPRETKNMNNMTYQVVVPTAVEDKEGRIRSLTSPLDSSGGEGSGNPLHRDLSGLNHSYPKASRASPTKKVEALTPPPPLLEPELEQRPLPEARPAAKISWKKGRLIGSGAFGKVFLGMDQQTGRLIAAKEFSFDPDDDVLAQRIAKLQREIQIMKNLEHENVVTYLGADRVGTNFYVFMEYVPGGSVLGLLNDCGPLQEQVASLYTAQMLTGIDFLHRSNVVHRDVKCANVLVTVEGVIKLADFGSAQQKIAGDKIKTMEGTTSWMAPEVVREEPASYSSDVWSLGCTLMEMLTGRPPWAHMGNSIHVMMQIGTAGQEGSALPPLPPDLDVSIECVNFLRLCLEPDQNRRPTAACLLSHPFVMRHLQAATKANADSFVADFYQSSFSVMKPDESGRRDVNSLSAGSVRRDSSSVRSALGPSRSIFGPTAHSFGIESIDPGDETVTRTERGGSVFTEHLSQLSLNTASDIARTISSLSSQSLKSHLSEKQQQSILHQVFRKGSPSSRVSSQPSVSASLVSNHSPGVIVTTTASFGSSQNTQHLIASHNSQMLPGPPAGFAENSSNSPSFLAMNHHATIDSLASPKIVAGPKLDLGAMSLFKPAQMDISSMSSDPNDASTTLVGAPTLAATLKPPMLGGGILNISEEGFTGKVTSEKIRAEMANQVRNSSNSSGRATTSSSRGSVQSHLSSIGGWMNVVLDHPEVMDDDYHHSSEFAENRTADAEFIITPHEEGGHGDDGFHTLGHIQRSVSGNHSSSSNNNRKSGRDRKIVGQEASSTSGGENSGGSMSTITKVLIAVVTLLSLLCVSLLVAVIVTNLDS